MKPKPCLKETQILAEQVLTKLAKRSIKSNKKGKNQISTEHQKCKYCCSYTKLMSIKTLYNIVRIAGKHNCAWVNFKGILDKFISVGIVFISKVRSINLHTKHFTHLAECLSKVPR
jgi:hypothetical protein